MPPIADAFFLRLEGSFRGPPLLFKKVSSRLPPAPPNIYPRYVQFPFSPSSLSPSSPKLPTMPGAHPGALSVTLPHILLKSRRWPSPSLGVPAGEKASSEEGRVCSRPATAYPGDSERHGFLFTREQLSGEKHNTRGPSA